jgi:hypothetical protein
MLKCQSCHFFWRQSNKFWQPNCCKPCHFLGCRWWQNGNLLLSNLSQPCTACNQNIYLLLPAHFMILVSAVHSSGHTIPVLCDMVKKWSVVHGNKQERKNFEWLLMWLVLVSCSEKWKWRQVNWNFEFSFVRWVPVWYPFWTSVLPEMWVKHRVWRGQWGRRMILAAIDNHSTVCPIFHIVPWEMQLCANKSWQWQPIYYKHGTFWAAAAAQCC